MKNTSGSGLSAIEARVGMTIAKNLEKMCLEFNRLHILLGERANVNPPSWGVVVGLPNQAKVYHNKREHDPADDFLADDPLQDEEVIENIASDDDEGVASQLKICLLSLAHSLVRFCLVYYLVFSGIDMRIFYVHCTKIEDDNLDGGKDIDDQSTPRAGTQVLPPNVSHESTMLSSPFPNDET